MMLTIRDGSKKASTGFEPTVNYHGTDFELLLESVHAKQAFTDLDPESRAHLLGLMQGIELAQTMRLENWDLRAPFLSLDN